jgi:hypothetical protein
MPQVILHRHEYKYPGMLPPVCVVCGQDAEEYHERELEWTPRWLFLFVFLCLFGLLPWVILTNLLRRTAKIYIPFCENHLTYWVTRSFYKLLFVVIGAGCMAAGLTTWLVANSLPSLRSSNLGGTGFMIGFAAFLVFLLIAAIYRTQGIEVAEITHRNVTMINVHPAFIAELGEMRKEMNRDLLTGAEHSFRDESE